MNGTLTDVAGIKVVYDSDLERGTGVTVVLTEAGAVAGVDMCGQRSGSRLGSEIYFKHKA